MKVLLVDDSRAARELTAAYLSEMGHPAVLAADGNAALELYYKDPPDVVLLDVEMPGLDGYAVAREIRRRGTDSGWIPIIFLSGRVNDEDVVKGLEAGGDDYLTKPVSPVVLRAKLGAMNRITEMRNRLLEMSKQLQDVNRALVKLSSLDGLTQIANRRSFDTALELEWQRGMRNAKPVALILGDVDFFKRYNDTYGHQSGDSCLQAVAGALTSAARRGNDIVARFGGEEFVMLLPDTPLPGALEVAERVLDSVRGLKLAHAKSEVAEHVTMSLGITVCVPSPTLSSEQLIKVADSALYQAKSEGRNRAAFKPLTM
jgi:diguanylate cyclase (GGDEF)-like protein